MCRPQPDVHRPARSPFVFRRQVSPAQQKILIQLRIFELRQRVWYAFNNIATVREHSVQPCPRGHCQAVVHMGDLFDEEPDVDRLAAWNRKVVVVWRPGRLNVVEFLIENDQVGSVGDMAKRGLVDTLQSISPGQRVAVGDRKTVHPGNRLQRESQTGDLAVFAGSKRIAFKSCSVVPDLRREPVGKPRVVIDIGSLVPVGHQEIQVVDKSWKFDVRLIQSQQVQFQRFVTRQITTHRDEQVSRLVAGRQKKSVPTGFVVVSCLVSVADEEAVVIAPAPRRLSTVPLFPVGVVRRAGHAVHLRPTAKSRRLDEFHVDEPKPRPIASRVGAFDQDHVFDQA